MVWKLKKTKAEDDGVVAADVVPETAVTEADDSADFVTGVGPSEIVFADPAPGEPVELYAEHMAAVDEAIASLTATKKQAAPPVANGSATSSTPIEPAPAASAADEDDWSLDAFAPYKPPQRSGADGGATAGNDLGAGRTSLEGLAPASGEPAEEIDFTQGVATGSGAGIGHTSPPDNSVLLDDDDLDLLTSHAAANVDDREWLLPGNGVESALPSVPIAVAPTIEEPERTLTGMDASSTGTPAVEEADQTLKFGAPVDDTELAPIVIAPPVVSEDDDRTVTHVNLSDDSEPIVTAPVVAQPPVAPKARLEVKLGQFTANYELAEADTVIGRPDPKTGEAPEVAIEWDDAISRRHAQVIHKSGRYFVVDLGSKNGTFVNGNQITAQTPIPLTTGDKIVVGEYTQITFVQS